MDLLVIAFGAIGFGVAIAALGISYFLMVRTSRSVVSIIQATRRLAQGDSSFRAPAPFTTHGRIMAEAFNRMVERVQADMDSLSGERKRLSEVLAIMDDGVVAVDSGGRILLSNPAACGILGVRMEQIEGRRFSEAIRNHQIQELVSRCVATGETQFGQLELRRPRKFISVNVTPLEDDQSREVLLTLHDYTRTQQAEASQREFVSNVSHELRNPLAAIKAMVETLEIGGVEREEVAQDFLRRISQDVDRMTKLVDDLLELSRLENGQFTLQLEDVTLADLLPEVKSRFDRILDEQGSTLLHSFPDDMPAINADADRLRQVLINLLENALKFTPAGGTITLATAQKDGFIEFRVEDTGVGIAPEHLPHVFERFYKVERSRGDSGTGLGLAIARQIIEAHGGQISVHSEEGVGSTFVFTVPLAP